MSDALALILPPLLFFWTGPQILAEKQMEGTWIVVSETWAGWPLPEPLRVSEVTIKGKRYSEKCGDHVQQQTIRFLPFTNPPALNLVDLDQEMGFFEAIYKLEGDTLTICYVIRRSQDRPTSFESGTDTPNALLVLRRKKAS